jgi:hypothetical protein
MFLDDNKMFFKLINCLIHTTLVCVILAFSFSFVIKRGGERERTIIFNKKNYYP